LYAIGWAITYYQEYIRFFVDILIMAFKKEVNNLARNKKLVPGASSALEKMKYEIANEFGVNLGGDVAAKQNGSVGGEMTKRLIQKGLGK
jgi:hypothetical protein